MTFIELAQVCHNVTHAGRLYNFDILNSVIRTQIQRIKKNKSSNLIYFLFIAVQLSEQNDDSWR